MDRQEGILVITLLASLSILTSVAFFANLLYLFIISGSLTIIGFTLLIFYSIRKDGEDYVPIDTSILSPKLDEELDWINQWKEVSKLDFSIENEHFFLERSFLDDFSKKLISHAKTEIMVANPFIQSCDLSNTLIEASKKGVIVKIITQLPKDNNPTNLKDKQDYHSILNEAGISIIYEKYIHAKINVVDNKVAIVSSMNFYARSSAGGSWEAGLVSINSEVVMKAHNFLTKTISNVRVERRL